jgi:DNA-binding MarR family transcriptional regulator
MLQNQGSKALLTLASYLRKLTIGDCLLPDKLGRLLFDFAARIRRYRNGRMARIEEAAGLSERDIAILDFVYQKGHAAFNEVAEELHIQDMPRSSASAISQAISALYIDQGMVEKRPNPKDQRQPIITLTEKGKAAVEKVKEMRIDMLTKVKAAMELSDADASVLERAYARGIANFDKIATAGNP